METEFEDKSSKKVLNYRELVTGYMYKLLNGSSPNSIIKAINYKTIVGVVLHNNSTNPLWAVLDKDSPFIDSLLFECVEHGEVKISW